MLAIADQSGVSQHDQQRGACNGRTRHTERHDDKTIRIEIQDGGGGITSTVLPKIFNAFFTTKPIGEGTGLGRSISYKVIEAHGGKILVDTENGIGITFSILLPTEQKQATAAIIADNESADLQPA